MEQREMLSIFSHSFQHLIWIERVAQAVTDVVDGDNADEDHQASDIYLIQF